MICASADIHTASRQLRHANLATTAAYYTDHRRRATVPVADILNPPLPKRDRRKANHDRRRFRGEVTPLSVRSFRQAQLWHDLVQPRCRFCANLPSRRSCLPASRWALRSGSLACFKYIPTKRGRPPPGLLLRRSHLNQRIIERIRGIMEDVIRTPPSRVRNDECGTSVW